MSLSSQNYFANKTGCCEDPEAPRQYEELLSDFPYPSADITKIERIDSSSRITVYALPSLGANELEKLKNLEPFARSLEGITPSPEGDYKYRSVYFSSGDGGKTWRELKEEQEYRTFYLKNRVNYKYQSSADSNVLYRKRDHLYERSNDGGKSWTQLRFKINASAKQPKLELMETHPQNAHLLYAYIWDDVKDSNFKSGMYMSADGGESWSFFTDAVSWLTVSKSKPSIMYGAIGAYFDRNEVKKSTDGGRTWHIVGQNEYFNRAYGNIPEWVKSRLRNEKDYEMEERFTLRPRLLQITIDPEEPSIVYIVSTKGIFKTTDGGSSWCLLKVGLPYNYNYNSLAVDPINHNIIYVGTKRDGLFKSTDQGCTWEKIEIYKRLVK